MVKKDGLFNVDITTGWSGRSDLFLLLQSSQRCLGGAFQTHQLRPAGGAAFVGDRWLIRACSETGQALEHVTTPTWLASYKERETEVFNSAWCH